MCRIHSRIDAYPLKKEAWNDVLVYLTGGIAKRLTRNKQSTPTPYRISIPLVGEWIIDKHERSLTAFSFVYMKLAISCKG